LFNNHPWLVHDLLSIPQKAPIFIQIPATV
jgi:hypothetical protein